MNLPRFIKAEEVRPGDTIVWSTNHSEYKLNYMVVKDVEEGETNFRGYDNRNKRVNGRPIFEGEEYNCYILTGKVMCKDGVRKDHYDHPKYTLTYITTVLLIDRKE